MKYQAPREFDVTTAVHLPMSERVLDRLADILFASDEILDMIKVADRLPDEVTVEIEDSVKGVWNNVNELMKKLAD